MRKPYIFSILFLITLSCVPAVYARSTLRPQSLLEKTYHAGSLEQHPYRASIFSIHGAAALESVAVEKLAPVAERMAGQIFSQEGLEIVAIDGDTASGKTTLGRIIYNLAQKKGQDVMLIDQDWFNFPHSVRVSLWKVLAGQVPLEESGLPDILKREDMQSGDEFLKDAELLKWDQFLAVLQQIDDFKKSGKEEAEINIPDLFVRGMPRRATLTFTITKKTKVILVGKYLHYRPETKALYSRRLCYRTECDSYDMWGRYRARTKKSYNHNEEELGLLENYYRMGMRPSFDRYRGATECLVTHHILVDSEPYEIIAAKGGGLTGEELVQFLRRPDVVGGVTKRWRFLTGEGDTYDTLIVDVFPHGLIPELRGGLSPALDRFERQARQSRQRWTWADGAGGMGNAIKEAHVRYPNLRPVLVDAMDWQRSDFPPEVAERLMRESGEHGIADIWDKEAVNFTQSDLSRVAIDSPQDAPARLITVFQALAYMDDPLGVIANLYNQLSPGGYFLVNTYIPTDYAGADELLNFYKGIFRDMQEHGIPVEFKVLDQRADALPAQKRKPGYKQYQVGIVIAKTETSPRSLVLRLEPQAPVTITMQWASRAGQYSVVEYSGNLSHPFVYTFSPLHMPETQERIRRVPVENRVLALELGGTWMRTALIDSRDGSILVSIPDLAVWNPGNADAVLGLVKQRAGRILRETGLDRSQIGAISLSAPGNLDEKTGVVILQKTLPFTGRNIRELLVQMLGEPVCVLNDTVAGLRAEVLYGTGRGRKFVGYLTVSTGTNAAYWASGKGAFDLQLWKYPCPDGHTVEERTSGKHMARLARERIKQPGGDRILELAGGNPEAIKGEHICQAYKEENPLAAALIEDSAVVLGRAIAAAMRQIPAENTVPGEKAFWVVGGGVAQGLGQPFIDKIQNAVPASVPVEIVLSGMPARHRGLLGAAAKASEMRAARQLNAADTLLEAVDEESISGDDRELIARDLVAANVCALRNRGAAAPADIINTELGNTARIRITSAEVTQDGCVILGFKIIGIPRVSSKEYRATYVPDRAYEIRTGQSDPIGSSELAAMVKNNKLRVLAAAPGKEPPTFFFDIGNVVLWSGYERTCRELQAFSPYNAEYIQDFIVNKSSAFWKTHTGESTLRDLFEEVKKGCALQDSLSYEKFESMWASQHIPNEEVAQFIQELKSLGYRVCFISDINMAHSDATTKRFPEVFADGVYDYVKSHEIGRLKQHGPGIYLAAFNRAGAHPANAVVIDDRPEYLAIAEKIGVHTYHYTRETGIGGLNRWVLESIIPPAQENIPQGRFLESVEQWIRVAGLTSKFGALGLLRQGRVLFESGISEDGLYFEAGAGIAPLSGQRKLGANGLYTDGSDCSEGAYRLLMELRDKGYAVRAKKAAAGIWERHIYVEARLGETWIGISTTPDMPHTGFPVKGEPEDISDDKLRASFEYARTRIPLQTGIYPLELFRSAENQNVLIASGIEFTGASKLGLPMMKAHVICNAYIFDDRHQTRSYGIKISFPMAFGPGFQNMPPAELKNRLERTTSEEERGAGIEESITVRDARRHIVDAMYEILTRIDSESARSASTAYINARRRSSAAPLREI